MRRQILVLAFLSLVAGILVAGCFQRAESDSSAAQEGRILVWHTWTGATADQIDEIISHFVEINPHVTIRHQSFANSEDLYTQFVAAVDSGLGPDVIVGPSTWVRPLSEIDAIEPIDSIVSEDLLQRYVPTALETLRYGENIYGLPLSLNTLALYYNKGLIDTPATTLDELALDAEEGNLVLMSTTFHDAFWGVQAFGGRLFDEDGQAILDQGGFSNWLAWLKNTRENPSLVLDTNREALRNRFLEGDAAYYVGSPAELSQITEALGPGIVGVAPLPAGPIGSAGPFLETRAFLFSTVSSASQRDLALELATFAANSEQLASLMRNAQVVPASSRVRVNPRLNPIVASFSSQARTAIPLRNSSAMDAVFALGDEAYIRALEGVVSPTEAAVAATQAINEANGLEALAAQEYSCNGLGTVRLLHHWEGEEAEILSTLIDRFRAICPYIIVRSEYAPLDDFVQHLAVDAPQRTRPDLILAPQRWLIRADVQEIGLADVSAFLSAEDLQPYRPVAVEALRLDTALYGLPESVQVDAFYYNLELVTEPAQVLDDLRMQAGLGIPIVLDVRFDRAFWGVGAFGGVLFGDENRPALDQDGFVKWLQWLKTSRDEFGIRLSRDGDELRELFASGRSAYYVGGPDELAALQEALGPDGLGVALLPAGPEGNATPLMEVTGLLLTNSSPENQVSLALEFAKFIAGSASQDLLARQVNHVPVNSMLEITDDLALAIFLEQIGSAFPVPNTSNVDAVIEIGDEAYVAVLQDGIPAEAAAADAISRINEVNGMVSQRDDENGDLEIEAEEPDVVEPDAEGATEQAEQESQFERENARAGD